MTGQKGRREKGGFQAPGVRRKGEKAVDGRRGQGTGYRGQPSDHRAIDSSGHRFIGASSSNSESRVASPEKAEVRRQKAEG